MEKTRKCSRCETPFPRSGKRLYCGPRCARATQLEQVKEGNDRRRARLRAEREANPRPDVGCDSCLLPFTPRTSRDKYCSDPCRAVGLARAVQRQRERRAKVRREAAEGEVKTGRRPRRSAPSTT